MNWGTSTDFDSVCRRAAGRRRYNAKRQAEARERFKIVLELTRPPEGRKRGSQARLARALGVHRSTICRDVASWKRTLLEAAQHWQELKEAGQESNADNENTPIIEDKISMA